MSESRADAAPVLSIVVPVHDEAANLPPLHARLAAVLKQLGLSHEILFVDDGSTDGSLEAVRRLRAGDPSVRAVALTRRFGQQAALTAGLAFARGEAVVTLDADLQNPPELIPELVAAWRRGAKVVHAVRRGTEGAGALKEPTSALFYRLLAWLSERPPEPGAADFRLLDRQVARALEQMPERHRFLRGMIGWLGFPEARVEFVAPARAAGRSKFGWSQMSGLAADAVVSSSAKPLRLSLWLGLFALVADAAYAAYALWARWQGVVVRGWSSQMLVTLLLGGAELVLLGLIGEYLGRVYEEVKGRPRFIVRELLGGDDTR